MPGMLYIPKELKNIKDRPKVYFCCHPEDFELCFEMLSKEYYEKAIDILRKIAEEYPHDIECAEYIKQVETVYVLTFKSQSAD